MNERETERRLRDWLDAQAPSVVPDSLRRAVAAVPATVPLRWPDQVAAALGPRRAAVPRPAWVLLLGAALLVALVGGALLVGSQQRKLPAVVPPVGQLFECPPGSNPDEPGPVDQARPPAAADPRVFDYQAFDRQAFDRRAGRLVAVANAGDGVETRGVETWTFDVCTNTWTRMHPNREPPDFGVGQLVYDVDSDVTIWVSSGRVWTYDLQANTWTEQGVAPAGATLMAYDPVSGLVVAHVPPDVWNYDVQTDSWTPIHTALEPRPGDVLFAYDASVDRIVACARGYERWPSWSTGSKELETWLFHIRTGTWSRTGAVMQPDFNAPALAYDEAAERTVMMGHGHAAAYDATADRWESLWAKPDGVDEGACGTRPECRGAPGMVYDPVNERLVVYGGRFWTGSHWVSPDDVLAFDTRTREWTVLLEASAAQPAP